MAHPALAGLQGVDWVDVRLLEELSFLGQERGYSTPGRQYLADIIGCTIRTVSRHLTKLVKLGYLQRTLRTYRQADGTIINRTNLYRVALDCQARIQAFLHSLTGHFTGETPPSRKPKTKDNIQLKKDRFSFQRGPEPPKPTEPWSSSWQRWNPKRLFQPSAPLSPEEQGGIRPQLQRFADLGRG